ncbi:hypothetical protein M0R45_002516 [Rubus argutus]|uniref:non-specific serine/threonine protein kinase n=1 Tax=Rubus argutus TaxID=59490 RepID=A0AAW1VT01_RUBAR
MRSSKAHVGDFGLAKVIDMPHSKSMSAVAGSYGYIAPEYAYTMKVTEKMRLYSYGVVLLELLTGRKLPRLKSSDKSMVDHMLTVLKIALMCTEYVPFDRPSIREVVLMLIESNEQEGDFVPSPTYDLPLKTIQIFL